MSRAERLLKQELWREAASRAASPERVRQRLREWDEADPALADLREVSREQARILAAVWSGSQAVSRLLRKHPEWLGAMTPERLAHPRQAQGLRREVQSALEPMFAARDSAAALAWLRQFKERETCRIAARDLARLGTVLEIVRELSDLADVCLATVLRVCGEQLEARLGRAYHQDATGVWKRTAMLVLGLGKLGGQELNYSSDVDVMLVYTEEGFVFSEPPGPRAKAGAGARSHVFFRKLAESFVAEVTRATPEGTLYRVDLRLRPEGDAGPLAWSLPGCENYYAQWGQTWERMMLIKARCVAGDAALADEFFETIQSFRYPRHLSERVVQEMAQMKARVELEVVRSGELDRNVKLGRGGIREVEFIAQTAQILHAGRIPFLQGNQTLPTLEKLAQYDLLAPDESRRLKEAYCFLREVEHRVQMEDHLQTHTIPAGLADRERLARLMGHTDSAAFEAARQGHCAQVRALYDRQLPEVSAGSQGAAWPRDLASQKETWLGILAEHRFREAPQALRLLKEFIEGPGFVHTSTRTVELAWELVPRLLKLCPGPRLGEGAPDFDPQRRILSDPDRVLARLDSFIQRYGARSVLFETWAHHPAYFELLLLLFDRSEFLAETALQTPDLVDDLVMSGRLNRVKTVTETLAELQRGNSDTDQHRWLRRYHHAEITRIGLRTILGLSDHEQALNELSHLAEACLQYALEVVLGRRRLKQAALAVIGLGKLGGREIVFGSDLDVMFVADAATKDLAPLQRAAAEVMELLSARTEAGIVFETDARLRPDGEKGLLVNTLSAFEEYYRHRAQLWEIQALTRARPVAGDVALGRRFEAMAGGLTDFRPVNRERGFVGAPRGTGIHRGLACFVPDWKEKIHAMRMRIEKERTPAGQQALAFKTGAGGLMDAEFIAQAMCLKHGWQEGNTLRALERIRGQPSLRAEDVNRLIENYRPLLRLECILRLWSLEGETELPVDAAPYYRVSLRCGFKTPEAFREAVAGWRAEIRRVYNLIFQSQASEARGRPAEAAKRTKPQTQGRGLPSRSRAVQRNAGRTAAGAGKRLARTVLNRSNVRSKKRSGGPSQGTRARRKARTTHRKKG